MKSSEVTKAALIEVLQYWSKGEMTSCQLQDWMVLNYDPDEISVGVGEASQTVDAMNIVMNEYELAKPEKFVVANADLALAFISATASEFDSRKLKFIQQGFID